MKMKITGHNSYPKFGLAGQHSGGRTIKQDEQSERDKRRHATEEKWQMPVASSTIITYRPHSILHDPGTLTPVDDLRNRFKQRRYGRLHTGQIVSLAAARPWRGKSDRRQVVVARREDREAAKANAKS